VVGKVLAHHVGRVLVQEAGVILEALKEAWELHPSKVVEVCS
jgi:hypothetical protein